MEVTKPYAFSWTIQCLAPAKGGYRLRSGCIPKEKAAWDKAIVIARHALSGRATQITCADHYAVHYIHPVWSRQMFRESWVGAHVFYVSRPRALACVHKSGVTIL